MEFTEYSSNARDYFDNVYAIHLKNSSIKCIKKLVAYFERKGGEVKYSDINSENSNKIDYEYIERYYAGKEEDYPLLNITINNIHLNCFLEVRETLSLWFNDSGDMELNEKKYNEIKSIMRELAIIFERSIYFVNEGEPNYRYKLFKYNNEGVESEYNLKNKSSYIERVK